jgi:hypothetical protein
MNPRSRAKLVIRLGSPVIFGLSMTSFSVSALNDSYLEMLEEESNDVFIDDTTPDAGGGAEEQGGKDSTEREMVFTEGDSAEFEATLRDYYPGSYRLFTKLDAEQQQQVLDGFAKDASYSRATRLILRLSMESR